MISDDVSPLVRERSRVQSSLAAPPNPTEILKEISEAGGSAVCRIDAKSANERETRRRKRCENGAGKLKEPLPTKAELLRSLKAYAKTEVRARRTAPALTRMPEAQLYRHFNEWGDLLYVGISASAAARLCGHKDGSPWFHEIAFVTIEHFDTREEAAEAEVRVIQEEDPIYNLKRRGKPAAEFIGPPEPIGLNPDGETWENDRPKRR